MNEPIIAHDMPKLHSPLIRQHNEKKFYVVTQEYDPDYLWVFEDPDVVAMEKLDGTNVSVIVQDGKITEIYNRTNPVCKLEDNELKFKTGFQHFDEAFHNAFKYGMLDLPDGQHFGELVGPRLNSNPLKLKEHTWIPFETFGMDNLVYKDVWKIIKSDFESISTYFRNELRSKFFELMHDDKTEYAEGLVLYRPSTGERAKLRRDMFGWWVEDNPGKLSKHVIQTKWDSKPKTPMPDGLKKDMFILSQRHKQGLITYEEFDRDRTETLRKYGITPKQKQE